MDYKGLTTIMRESSASYGQDIVAKEYMNRELAVLEQQRDEIIDIVCMPAARMLESVIKKWQKSYVGDGQTINPDGANWSGDATKGWEYRTPISHSLSDMNITTQFGNPLKADSTVDTWTIEQWQIWEKTGSGAGATWTRYDSSEDQLMSTVSYSDLTNATLTSLGFSSEVTLSFLQQYIDQWDLGMEWLHARPVAFSPFSSSKVAITDNPYAGDSRTFGVLFKIESLAAGRTSMDTNTNFKKSLADKWDQLLT